MFMGWRKALKEAPPTMIRRILRTLAFVAALAPFSSQAAITASDFLTLTYTDSGGTLPYRMYVPGGYSAATKYPLVLFLHGVGENGNNNTSQLNNRANGAFVFAEQAANPAFMIAPQNWNGASGWGSPVLRTQILAVIQKAQNDYNIDKDRIYVVGLSNGGAGTWDQLNTYPWLYAAGVPCCGWGTATEKIKNIPVWNFHAANDPTVGIASSDNVINGLRNLGGNPIYTRYDTGGHGSWGPAYQTPEMVNWLFAQRRGVRDWTNIPNLAITSPTPNRGYHTTATTLALSGTATDMLPADGANTGITSIAWTNDRGGSGTATGTTSWSIPSVGLVSGLNKIRVLATGTSFKSGNGGNTTFTDVIFVRQATAGDTTAPVVTITSPATTPITVTSQLYTMVGSASDANGVVDFYWSSDRGYNGTCDSSWPIVLLPGANVITVSAKDAAGNIGTKVVTINFNAPSGNQPPSVSAGRDQTVILPANSISLDGTITDDGLAPGNTSTTASWSKVSGPGTVMFANASSVDTTATFSAAGVYVIRLTGSDGALSATNDATVVVGQQRLLFDFGDPALTTTGNWNNVTTITTGAKITGAKDSTGATTAVNLSLPAAFTGINANGTTTATFFPGTAQQDSFYVGNTAVGQVQLTGLDTAASYHFTFFASRSTVDDRNTVYTINGTSVSMDASDNTLNVVHITNVTPAAGGTVTLSIAADNGTGYGYLGVLDVVRLSASTGDTTAPSVSITAPTSNATTTVTTSTINIGGTASDNVGVTQVTWGNDRGGSGTATGTTAWSVSNVALLSGVNVITVTARDAANNTSTDTLTVTYNPPDTTAPVVTITTPTSNATIAVTTATINMGGTASDAVGVTQVAWANDRGGSGVATGTTAWSVNNIALLSGANVITVTARDAANNTSTDTLTVTYTPPDTTVPTVAITTPTTNATTTVTTATINLGGTSSDNVGVTQVTWTNDRGGSGIATGTTAWTISNIALVSGANVITVTARDAANNTATDTITATFNSPDTTIPAVTITAPTANATATVTIATINLGGTASDNVGVSQVTWANNRGGSGTATGTTAWTVSNIALLSGANVITVTARDAANNTATDTITVTYNPPDTTAPVVTITTPTSNATTTVTTATISIGGTASDAVGVTQVTWANNRGGSGTATGTTAWTVNGIALLSGANVISVTARDASNNTSSDTLTVTYNPVQPPANSSPTLASGPLANPNPAVAGAAVTFAVAANDTDNDTLAYLWDFADGSNAVEAAPIHTFANAGSYVVGVTVSDGKGGSVTGSVTVVVNAPNNGGGNGGGGSAPTDSDNDGVSDADEIAAGTDPLNPNSGLMKPLLVTSLQGSVKFGVQGKDGVRVSGIVSGLPAQFKTDGVKVILNAGGATEIFTLNAKGAAKTATGTFVLKLKLTTDKATRTKSFLGGDAPFKAKLAKGTWADDWADEGITGTADAKNVPMQMLVKLTLNGQLYGVTIDATRNEKVGKGATFKKLK